MSPIFLEDFSFWDVIWWMIIIFFWTLFLWMFIATFSDIFRRTDLSGWAKAGWSFLILILPLLGIFIYMIFRPPVTESDLRMAADAQRMMGYSPTEEIAKAQQLLQSGAISQQEFDAIKQRALG